MVFVKVDDFLDLHIRTETRGHWSAVIAIALRFGSDILEIYGDGFQIQVNHSPNNIPAALDGLYPLSVTSSSVQVSLPAAQSITFVQHYASGIMIRVDGHGSYFYDAVGMCGKWNMIGFIGRDNSTSLEDAYEFANEWQVNTTIGDPSLFYTPPENIVDILPPIPPEFTDEEIEAAILICDQLSPFINEEAFQNCIYDAVIVEEENVLDNPAYVDPFVPTDRCLEPGENATTCADLGGECVYECDSDLFNCIASSGCAINPDLEFLDGETVGSCACAFPITESPTTFPSLSPSVVPSNSPTVPPEGCTLHSNCICEEYPGKMIYRLS